MVEDLLGGAGLLDDAVLHDDDAVAQGHGLHLVVGDVDEGGVDLLPELDDLRAHLVAELGVQVGEGLIHQKDLGVPDDGPADGDALPLAAGEGLGPPVQVLGDVQDLRGLPHLAVDLLLGGLLQLQGEGHVLIDGHVGVEGVVLEDHGDVPVLGGHVVHHLAVDGQLAAADLLQARDHPQGGGLAAAGGTDQNDELPVRDLQVEVVHRQDALLRDLQPPRGGFLALLFLLFLGVGIDLLDVLQGYCCHARCSDGPASARTASRPGNARAAFTAGLHTAAPLSLRGYPSFLSRSGAIKWSHGGGAECPGKAGKRANVCPQTILAWRRGTVKPPESRTFRRLFGDFTGKWVPSVPERP